jgi:hypothetical protein
MQSEKREGEGGSRKGERTRKSMQQNKMLQQCSESLYRIVRAAMIRQGGGKGSASKGCLHITWGRWSSLSPCVCVSERLFCSFASPKTKPDCLLGALRETLK